MQNLFNRNSKLGIYNFQILECPFDFEAAYGQALRRESGGVPMTFVGLNVLLALKRGAGRPQDLVDVAQLEALEQRKEPGDGA